jgi:hypothetical protein
VTHHDTESVGASYLGSWRMSFIGEPGPLRRDMR